MVRHAAHLLLAVVLPLLAACGPGASPPTPTPALRAISANPARPTNGPVATISGSGQALPGRMLFAVNGDLWVWQGNTGRQLTSQGNLLQPAWSPDGTRIACVQRDTSSSDLVILSADGTDPVKLTDNGATAPPTSYDRIYATIWAFYPAFSPDGREIAFASQYGPPFGSPAADYNLSLYVIPAAAGASRAQIYAGADSYVGRMAYAPDGQSIVFANSPTSADAPQLLRYSRSSNTAAPLPGLPEQSYDPAFSPDGRWLAFAARDGGQTDIFAIPAAGGTPARLTHVGTARAPAFSPDGNLIAFLALDPQAAQFDLWVIDISAEADGLRAGQPRQITQAIEIDADSGLAWGH